MRLASKWGGVENAFRAHQMKRDLDKLDEIDQRGNFFLMTTPGLEELALTEWQTKRRLLADIYPSHAIGTNGESGQIVSGGVEIEVGLVEGWVLNHYLRIPTRILQRLETFRCREYLRLQEKVGRFGWHQYLREGEVKVHVSYHRTRLNMKKRLVEAVNSGLDMARTKQKFRKIHLKTPQNIFLRIEGDRATLSIDTSGELLYRRGYKNCVTKAPIRETLASALFWLVCSSVKDCPVCILDPMCGSGTLGLEPLVFWQSLVKRSFSYQNFPSAPSLIPSSVSAGLKSDRGAMETFFGDIDPSAILATRANSNALFGRELPPSKAILGDWLECWDLVDFLRPLLMVVNPPYNERLKQNQDSLISDFSKMLRKVKPDICGVVWPGRVLPRLPGRWIKSVATLNGGLPVTLGVLCKDSSTAVEAL